MHFWGLHHGAPLFQGRLSQTACESRDGGWRRSGAGCTAARAETGGPIGTSEGNDSSRVDRLPQASQPRPNWQDPGKAETRWPLTARPGGFQLCPMRARLNRLAGSYLWKNGTGQNSGEGPCSGWGVANSMKTPGHEGRDRRMKRDCATCMFFDGDYPGLHRSEGGSEGVCRAVPPTVALYGGGLYT